MPPTSLDRLYRFSKHDEVFHVSPGITWVVSAGSLEQTTRMYRYAYTHANGCTVNHHIEHEVVLCLEGSLKKNEREDLMNLCMDLRRFAMDITMAPHFRLACLDLLSEDPWLVFIHGGGAPIDACAK